MFESVDKYKSRSVLS